jgi:RNA polymerase sigma-70 factor (ECF subfamily)
VKFQIDEMRPRVMSVAYRMLKHVADAEDAVQDAFLRLHATAGVTSPEGFLVSTTTRRCIDHLRKHRRRNAHSSRWASEYSDIAAATNADSNEHVKQAFQVMLERLSPQERAAFLMRKVFNYEYAQIALVLHKSAGYARQIVCRAQSKLAVECPRFQVATHEAERLTEKFIVACRDGDLRCIEQMFAEDAPDDSLSSSCVVKTRSTNQLQNRAAIPA